MWNAILEYSYTCLISYYFCLVVDSSRKVCLLCFVLPADRT